jgi:isocitrate dehydrogenase (NAD+)
VSVAETARTVTLIPGDGVGPEITAATVQVLEAAGVPLRWERVEAGSDAVARYGTPIPAAAIASIRRNRVALKARLVVPPGSAFESPNVTLRKVLDLYANVRPVRSFPGRPSRHPDVDLVIVRENTEGEYAGLEHHVVPGVVESIKITSERACTRIARFAFALAAREGRKRVTAVHKANIMKRADGLFLDCCRAVAKDYPALEYRELIVDNACMQLVMNPRQFDVVVTQNFYGDLISDLAAGLVGGIGVVPGGNFGDEVAVFEAVHGYAPELAGKNVANPMTMLVSALYLLRHLGLAADADRIVAGAGRVLADRRHVTPDLGGRATTTDMAAAIAAALPPR